jgi:hypothetical protein
MIPWWSLRVIVAPKWPGIVAAVSNETDHPMDLAALDRALAIAADGGWRVRELVGWVALATHHVPQRASVREF